MEKEIIYHSEVNDIRLCREGDKIRIQVSDNKATVSVVIEVIEAIDICDSINDLCKEID